MSFPTIPSKKGRIARPHVPKAAPAPPGSWIIEAGGAGGGSIGIPDAPPVTIVPPPEVIFRSDHKVEVDVIWTPSASANAQNFAGVSVYLEDPDISSGANGPMDGNSVPLDGSAQMSGKWAPIYVNDSLKSPAVVFLDSTMGSLPGQTYTRPRDIRIYLAAFGPNSQPTLVRATEPNPTPNIMVNIPLARGQGESGQEYAFLVSNVRCEVTPDYARVDPKWYVKFFYDPPDPATPVPPGMNRFGGVRIIFVYEDANGNPQFPGTDTGINVPVAQSQSGYSSPAYSPDARSFRAYFCSEDDSQPLGNHINSLVEGVTPYCEVGSQAVPSAPDVTDFAIRDQKYVWLLDGSFVAQATFSWSLPAGNDKVRYAGIYLYLVSVTGGTSPLTQFPQALTGQQSNVDEAFILGISNLPANPEDWIIAAISVDNNGVLADDPTKYGQASFHSPTVTWNNIGPPSPGSPGGCREYAPFVTIDLAQVTPTESLSADGVGMVSFDVGSWRNPSDNQFGGAQLAMVVNNDPTKSTYWSIPKDQTSFVTPAMPSFGNIGAQVPVDFYIVSDDPQGHRNTLCPGTTPVINYVYTPSEGKVIPAREGWFDPSQFAWDESEGGFQAQSFSAKVIQVGKTLVVGGAPASFGGSDNGQIAVMNSSGVLRAWMGEQQPGQGDGAPKWGGWFGQIWIGGTNPLDAPIFVDNQGIIQVGGIAAAQGARYPYLSIRDDHGYEKGRIGAQISQPSGSPGDGTGPNPPLQLTSGAWFTQLAIGGSNLSNWNVLVIPDPNNPLGSQFQMRNIDLFLIDYPAQYGTPANNEYQLKMGKSVWSSGSGASQWQFPGMQIYEVDNYQNLFGAVYINRGMVLRGTQTQGYPVLASLVTYNGQESGSDQPPYALFWGELAMYSPDAHYRTVYLASGSAANGGGYFILRDLNNHLNFEVDQSGNTYVGGVLQGSKDPSTGANRPVNALALNISGYGPVIDAQGYWKGQPITVVAAQTPWTQSINGAGYALLNAGNISAFQYMVNEGPNPVIDQHGAFRGSGIDLPTSIGSGGIGCSSLTTRGGPVTCGSFVCTGSFQTSVLTADSQLNVAGWSVIDGDKNFFAHRYFIATWSQSSPVINEYGQFVGPGINVGPEGIACGSIGCSGEIDCGVAAPTWSLRARGDVQAYRYFVNNVGSPVIDERGFFVGRGIGIGLNGIICGQLNTSGGRIDCGSLNCTGQLNMGSLSVSGDILARRYLMSSGAVAVREDNVFVGGGVDVYLGPVYCGYLEVRANWIACPEVRCAADVNCRSLNINEWITTHEGWALVAPDHRVWCGQLFANYWSGSQPVINTSGTFTGNGVNVGYASIYCGYLNTNNQPLELGGGKLYCSGIEARGQPVFCGDVNSTNNVTANANMTANGSYYGGWFRGAGVDVYYSPVYCGVINVRGGNIDSVGNLNANNVFTNAIYVGGYLKCSSNGVWTGSVQCYDNVFASQFGIMNVGIGWPQGGRPDPYPVGAQDSFATGDGRRCYVSGGFIVRVQ
jgi:hypothetical protein